MARRCDYPVHVESRDGGRGRRCHDGACGRDGAAPDDDRRRSRAAPTDAPTTPRSRRCATRSTAGAEGSRGAVRARARPRCARTSSTTRSSTAKAWRAMRRVQPRRRPPDRRHLQRAGQARRGAARVLGRRRAAAQGRERPARARERAQAGRRPRRRVRAARRRRRRWRRTIAGSRSSSPTSRTRLGRDRRGARSLRRDRRRRRARRTAVKYPAAQRLAQIDHAARARPPRRRQGRRRDGARARDRRARASHGGTENDIKVYLTWDTDKQRRRSVGHEPGRRARVLRPQAGPVRRGALRRRHHRLRARELHRAARAPGRVPRAGQLLRRRPRELLGGARRGRRDPRRGQADRDSVTCCRIDCSTSVRPSPSPASTSEDAQVKHHSHVCSPRCARAAARPAVDLAPIAERPPGERRARTICAARARAPAARPCAATSMVRITATTAGSRSAPARRSPASREIRASRRGAVVAIGHGDAAGRLWLRAGARVRLGQDDRRRAPRDARRPRSRCAAAPRSSPRVDARGAIDGRRRLRPRRRRRRHDVITPTGARPELADWSLALERDDAGAGVGKMETEGDDGKAEPLALRKVMRQVHTARRPRDHRGRARVLTDARSAGRARARSASRCPTARC